MWVFSIYTMVDGLFVAHYVGERSLSAINVALPFVNTLFSIAILFSTGTATLIGITMGRGDHTAANKIFSFTAAFELLFSIFLYLVCRLNLSRIVTALGATPAIYDDVFLYLKIILLFNGFFIISYNFEVLVKTDGFPRLATIGVCLSAVTNIFLDYLFVGIFHWGVGGAAWATGIAQVFSTLLFLYHFVYGKSTLQFQSFQWNFKIYAKILPIGFGSFISEMSTGIIVFLYNHYILLLIGEQGLISYTVISYVNLFVSMSMIGLTQGMQPLVSYYYGKREPEEYHHFLKFSIIGVLCLSVLSYGISFFCTDFLTTIFIQPSNKDLFDYTTSALLYFSPSFLLVGFNLLIAGYFAAVGYAKHSVFIALARGFVFIWISLAITFSLQNETLLWLAAFFAELITLICSGILLYVTLHKNKQFM